MSKQFVEDKFTYNTAHHKRPNAPSVDAAER